MPLKIFDDDPFTTTAFCFAHIHRASVVFPLAPSGSQYQLIVRSFGSVLRSSKTSFCHLQSGSSSPPVMAATPDQYLCFPSWVSSLRQYWEALSSSFDLCRSQWIRSVMSRKVSIGRLFFLNAHHPWRCGVSSPSPRSLCMAYRVANSSRRFLIALTSSSV